MRQEHHAHSRVHQFFGHRGRRRCRRRHGRCHGVPVCRATHRPEGSAACLHGGPAHGRVRPVRESVRAHLDLRPPLYGSTDARRPHLAALERWSDHAGELRRNVRQTQSHEGRPDSVSVGHPPPGAPSPKLFPTRSSRRGGLASWPALGTPRRSSPAERKRDAPSRSASSGIGGPSSSVCLADELVGLGHAGGVDTRSRLDCRLCCRFR